MSVSSRFRKKTTKLCLGDLDTVVNIYKRNLKVPKDVKYNLNIELIRENVWVMWDVKENGVELFDGVNQSIGTATDIIKLHYDKDFRTDFDYIELDGKLYEVLLSDWLDTRCKEFIVLYCVMKGDKNKKVNIL